MAEQCGPTLGRAEVFNPAIAAVRSPKSTGFPKEVVVNDKMQQNYRYLLSEPRGRTFIPISNPELTPIQMLDMGGF